MNNLSLLSIQIAPQKSASEAVSKNDTNADKADSGLSKTSFQAELSNQVQAKQAKHVQSKSGQEDKKTPTKSGDQLVAKETNVGSQNKTKRNAPDSDLPVDEAAPSLGVNYLPATHVKVAVSGVSSDDDSVDAKVKDSAVDIAVDANTVSLTTPVTLPAPLVNANASAQKDAGEAVRGSDSALLTAPVVTTQGSNSLDTVLNNALTSGKGMSTLFNNDSAGSNESQILDGKVTSDNSRWIDSMLLSASKQAAVQGSVNDVLMSKAMSSAKDVAVNDIASLSANYQPTLQVANASMMQQADSPNYINAYPGKSGWDQAISQKVVWMVGAGEQSATLTLNPPDLGPLQVVIHVHNDQADTTFISDNAEVRQALENGFSNLRDKMSESGIQLGQANVSTGSQSQQAFQQSPQERVGTQLNDNGFIAQPEVSTKVMVQTANGLVDTFA